MRIWRDSGKTNPRGSKPTIQLLDERIRLFKPSDRLTESLHQARISVGALAAGRSRIVEDPAYDGALEACTEDLEEFRLVWARAVIAALIMDLDIDDIDREMLSKLATMLAAEVGNQPKGVIGDWLGRALATVATPSVARRRAYYSDLVVPYVGDVLVYQANGQCIRDMIDRCIQGADPGAPVVLIGHSLGGVACVDLLAENPQPSVKLLITVGSQAPLFYEMNALQKLRFGQPLPEYFPRWHNIYDLRDFLSFVVEPVFKDGRFTSMKDDRVTDMEVDNGKQFPRSHGAYWSNPVVWDVIVPLLIGVSRWAKGLGSSRRRRGRCWWRWSPTRRAPASN